VELRSAGGKARPEEEGTVDLTPSAVNVLFLGVAGGE
jgi:hypothetical protein